MGSVGKDGLPLNMAILDIYVRFPCVILFQVALFDSSEKTSERYFVVIVLPEPILQMIPFGLKYC